MGEIAEPFPISGPAISRHLKVLEEAELIARTRRGQQLVCRLNPARPEDARRNGWTITAPSGAAPSTASTPISRPNPEDNKP